MSTGNKHDSGAAQGARRATEQAPESSPASGGGRWSARRKLSVILELLRGADLEATSRKYRVTVATLTQWRDRFLASGEAGMKSREVAVDDEENRRLKSVVANLLDALHSSYGIDVLPPRRAVVPPPSGRTQSSASCPGAE